MGVLTVAGIRKLQEPGKYLDGAGLYLVVSPSKSRSWVFRYTLNKRPREMGLGAVDAVTLLDARDRANDLRRKIRSGVDPLDEKSMNRVRAKAHAASARTFEQCALEYIAVRGVGWTCKRNAKNWESSLRAYAFGPIGQLPVSEVTREMVVAIVEAIWAEKYVTAMNVRTRIERILGYATVKGYRSGDNPARWRDNLEHVFEISGNKKKTSHFPAVPRAELPEFFQKLKRFSEVTHSALALQILLVPRTGELRLAEWSEFDMEKRLWVIPAGRMKAREEHVIPLSEAAIEILRVRQSKARNRYVFPGRIGGRPISDMSLLQVMRRFGRSEVPHGFRSTFKDWASEVYGAEDDVSEAALAHKIKNQTKAAYLRGKFVDKRRELMEAWATFCLTHSG